MPQIRRFPTKPEADAHAVFLGTLGYECKVYHGHRGHVVKYWLLAEVTDADLVTRLAATRPQLEAWVAELESRRPAQPKDLIRKGPAP